MDKKEKNSVSKHEKPSGKIAKDILISDLVSKHPEAIPALLETGMHCIGCGAAMFETLEDGLRLHGMSDNEIDELVDRLNKIPTHKNG